MPPGQGFSKGARCARALKLDWYDYLTPDVACQLLRKRHPPIFQNEIVAVPSFAVKWSGLEGAARKRLRSLLHREPKVLLCPARLFLEAFLIVAGAVHV